jgi:plasmid replication initiation protein
MVNSFYIALKNQLEVSSTITYREVLEILDAFQIASGQSFAIGKTKALLDFLKQGKYFDDTGNTKEVSSVKELVNIYKDIDQFVDLSNDKDFKEYFA